MTKKIVVFGSDKMAQLADFYFTHDSDLDVIAFTVDEAYLDSKECFGRPLVPFEEVANHYSPDDYDMFIAVGYNGLNGLRATKFQQAKEKGYHLVSYLSSKATHWDDTRFGENCFILENQVIQPFVTFGDNVIIWSGNHFGHDVVIEDHCWISSQVVLSGGVRVGERTFIGVNATVRDQVSIGRECIIGAGALILNNTKDRQVFIAEGTELYRLDSVRFERMMEISRRTAPKS